MHINRKLRFFASLYWALNNARALDYPNPESKIQNNSSPDNFLLASRSRRPAAEFGTGFGFGFGPSFAPSRPKNRKAETKIEALSSRLATVDIKIETKRK